MGISELFLIPGVPIRCTICSSKRKTQLTQEIVSSLGMGQYGFLGILLLYCYYISSVTHLGCLFAKKIVVQWVTPTGTHNIGMTT